MTFPISAKCPCGFSAEGPDAAQLYREHTCPKPPTPTAAIVAILVAMVSAIVLVTWIITWGITS